MLYSIFTPLLIAWYTARSTASPIVHTSTTVTVSQQSVNAVWHAGVVNPEDQDLDIATHQVDPASGLSINQADVVVACQGCGEDGADAFPAFHFTIEPSTGQDCSVTCAINGSTLWLSESNPKASLSVRAPDQPTYDVQAELLCTSGNTDGAIVPRPIVLVRLGKADKQSPQDTGFRVTTTSSGLISSVHIFSQIRAGEFSATPTVPSTGSKEDALELIHQIEVIRHLLSEQAHKLRPGSEIISNFEHIHPSNISAEQCVAHLKHKVACVAQRASQGIGEGLLSLLDHLGSSLGQDRTSRYTGHVQAAMQAMAQQFDCGKEKSEKEAITVTVTEVSAELDQEPKKQVELSKVPTPLVRALEVLAAALGIGGLLAFIRRRYCSLRRRVERLADREERIKAREYRRAAHKEKQRRRWASIKRTFTSCFTGGHTLDDEEKHALMLNAAETGCSDETLGAAMCHLDGLHYAHDVTVQMVQAGHFAALGPLFHARDARSRASSLPSYNSEVLPDYSSQPDTNNMVNSIMVVDGFRRPASRTSTTGSSRFTPDSSIPDISTRPSLETLRTQGTSEDV